MELTAPGRRRASKNYTKEFREMVGDPRLALCDCRNIKHRTDLEAKLFIHACRAGIAISHVKKGSVATFKYVLGDSCAQYLRVALAPVLRVRAYAAHFGCTVEPHALAGHRDERVVIVENAQIPA